MNWKIENIDVRKSSTIIAYTKRNNKKNHDKRTYAEQKKKRKKTHKKKKNKRKRKKILWSRSVKSRNLCVQYLDRMRRREKKESDRGWESAGGLSEKKKN